MAGRPDVSCPLPPDPPGIRALVCEAIGKIRARSKFQNFKISGVGSKQGRGKVEAGSILSRNESMLSRAPSGVSLCTIGSHPLAPTDYLL